MKKQRKRYAPEEKYGSGAPPLPTSMDLYQELQAVTPDSFQYLATRSLREEHVLGIRDAARHGAADRRRSLAGDDRRARAQTITVTVPQKPARAGIDPRHLLSELGETDNNIKAVKIER